jgi:hypothetical protein
MRFPVGPITDAVLRPSLTQNASEKAMGVIRIHKAKHSISLPFDLSNKSAYFLLTLETEPYIASSLIPLN